PRDAVPRPHATVRGREAARRGEVGAGPEARLEELGGPAEEGVEPGEQAARRPPEEGGKRRAGRVVAGLADRKLLPPVVSALAVERLLHELGERDRPPPGDAGAEAFGGGRGARIVVHGAGRDSLTAARGARDRESHSRGSADAVLHWQACRTPWRRSWTKRGGSPSLFMRT